MIGIGQEPKQLGGFVLEVIKRQIEMRKMRKSESRHHLIDSFRANRAFRQGQCVYMRVVIRGRRETVVFVEVHEHSETSVLDRVLR